MDRLKHMKETLMCCVEGQMSHLDMVDTKELGEAIDMLKDLEEAIYYATITKAMKEQDEDEKVEKKIKRYTDEYGPSTSSARPAEPMNGHEATTGTPHEHEMEGRSGRSRRQYMDAKH
jgi:hypothetical protein